ncbi:MAG: YebC/PmpR family DNA-binding transcriptional regulator [Acidimicrobiia bacterium]|nr:YebC/PmpR family DNA-binding transcriptional regulator [Acidimicrobiia bacterium]MDH3470811.1 YebC/PmpR family DNA-binding transcriptional regulator [Acidimicrobiia bacterium]
MSGHSKWSTIKRKKGAKDAARGQLFAKLARAIEVSAREGGGDVEANYSLASAVEKAKAASMPHENIQRAIRRGAGDLEGVTYDEIWYEGYAPGGVALYVQCLTDNRNRVASDVRAAFTRNNGNMGEPGSVSYLFEQKGYLLASGEEDDVMAAAIDGGAEDVRPSGEQWEIITAPGDLKAVKQALDNADIACDTAEVTQLPTTTVPVGSDNAAKVLRLLDALDELDDVQSVFANFDISDEVMAEVVG